MSEQRPNRVQLIDLCERGFAQQSVWRNRDSSAAQRQLGECYALLKAGCEFYVRTEGQTHWVVVEFHGFDWFEYADHDGRGPTEDDRYYVPTAERLDSVGSGRDWY